MEAPNLTKTQELEPDNFRGNYQFAHMTHSVIADVLNSTPRKSFTDTENAKRHRTYADFFQQKSGVFLAGQRVPAQATSLGVGQFTR